MGFRGFFCEHTIPVLSGAVVLLGVVILLSGCAHGGGVHPSMENTAQTAVREADRMTSSVGTSAAGSSRTAFDLAVELMSKNPPGEEISISSRFPAWFGGKRAACSLTFDDGTLDQYLVAFPMMRERGIRGSFYLITGFVDKGTWQDGKIPRRLFSWEAAGELAGAGNEIGSHGVNHRDLRALYRTEGGREARRELRLSAETIKSRIDTGLLPAGEVLTFSWPFWRSTRELRAIASSYYLGARSGGGSMDRYFSSNGGVPVGYNQDLFNINSYGVRSRDRREDIAAFLWGIFSSGGWAVLDFHGIDNGSDGGGEGWDAISAEQFGNFLSLIDTGEFWVAPVGEVIRYSIERTRMAIRIEKAGDAGVLLSCEDGLDDEVFNLAVTVELRLESGSHLHRVIDENGEELVFEKLEDGWYRVDFRPDGRAYALLTDSGRLAYNIMR